LNIYFLSISLLSKMNNNDFTIHKQNMQKVFDVMQGVKCTICSVYLCDKEHEHASMIRYRTYVCSLRCEAIATLLYKNIPYWQ